MLFSSRVWLFLKIGKYGPSLDMTSAGSELPYAAPDISMPKWSHVPFKGQ